MSKRVAISVVVLLAIGAGLYVFVFKNLYYRPMSLERSGAANAWMKQGFSIALVWPRHTEPSLVEGVTMALEEVNAAGGPLAGKIRLRSFTETDDGGALAQNVVKDHGVVAVIGHELSGTTIPASLTYEQHGVLFLAAKSTDIRLTDHQFLYSFRLTLDDRVFAHALARFARSQGWKRIGVLHSRSDHGDAASAQFLTAARQVGLGIPFVESFFHEPAWNLQDFRAMLADVRVRHFDAIMLADELPWAAKLLADMAQMGVTEPILATNKLDSSETWPLARSASNDLYVASAVDPTSTIPAYVSFRQRFRRRFNADPGYGAAQGYEALMLFVGASERSRSADPLVVATTLRTNTWQGLFGQVSFAENGDVENRAVSIKHERDGVFRTVAIEPEEPEAPEIVEAPEATETPEPPKPPVEIQK